MEAVVVRFSPAHLVVLALVEPGRSASAAHALLRLSGSAPIVLDGLDLRDDEARLLRLVVTLTEPARDLTSEATRIGISLGVPVVSAEGLAQLLRFSDDTDEIWLTLASIDRSGSRQDDGWVPTLQTSSESDCSSLAVGEGSATLLPPPATCEQHLSGEDSGRASTTTDELNHLNSMLAQLGLQPLNLWARARYEHDHWELIDVTPESGSVHMLLADVITLNAVLTEVSRSAVEWREHHVSVARALLHDMNALTGPADRRRPRFLRRRPRAVALNIDVPHAAAAACTPPSSDTHRAGPADALALTAVQTGAWTALHFHFSADRAVESWADLRQGCAATLLRSLGARQLLRRARMTRRWRKSQSALISQRVTADPALSPAHGLTSGPDGSHGYTLLEGRLLFDASRGGIAQLDDCAKDAARLTGEAARSLVQQHTVPGLQEICARIIDRLDSSAALTAVLAALQHRLSEHLSRPNALALHRSGPWGAAHTRSYLQTATESQHWARASEMVVEMVLRGPQGRPGREPDRIDIALLERCASAALSAALARQADAAAIAQMSITFGPRHTARLEQTNSPFVDIGAFMGAVQLHQVSGLSTPQPPDEHGADEHPFLSLRRDPASQQARLLDLDDALRDLTGASIDGLIAVLATAADLPPPLQRASPSPTA